MPTRNPSRSWAAVNPRTLTQAFPKLSVADAKKLSRLMKTADGHDDVDAALDEANKLIDGYGVEAINSECARSFDRYYMNIVLLYVNLGNTYRTTIAYDTIESAFLITSWGDWSETFVQENCESKEEEPEEESEYTHLHKTEWDELSSKPIKDIFVRATRDPEFHEYRLILHDGTERVFVAPVELDNLIDVRDYVGRPANQTVERLMEVLEGEEIDPQLIAVGQYGLAGRKR